MAGAQLPIESVVKYIDDGVAQELKSRIKSALMVHAEEVVEQVATELCKDLKLNMQGYYDYRQLPGISLTLNVKGKSILV